MRTYNTHLNTFLTILVKLLKCYCMFGNKYTLLAGQNYECKTLRVAALCHLFQEAAWRTGTVTLSVLRVFLSTKITTRIPFELLNMNTYTSMSIA